MSLIGLTESDLQDQIHTLYENDNNTPATTDDDYLIRRNLINIMVNRWENNLGTLWNELWTNTTDDSTGGSLTVVSSTATYNTPTNFRFPGGYVRILNSNGTVYATYPVVKPEKAQTLGTGAAYAYFKGNHSAGYKLVLNPTPDSTINGKTINYDFYKRASKIAATTDIPEMSDPYYIVHGVVAELHKADNNLALYDATIAEAEERLKQMAFQNALEANYQDWGMEDQQSINTGGYFGG